MKVYILRNQEQTIEQMGEQEIVDFCSTHNMTAFTFHCSFAWNDWNWIRQYTDILHIIADSLESARSFILNAYYHAGEFDGDSGVIFRSVVPLCPALPA